MESVWVLAAHDGADEDGGTLYVLYEDNGAFWTPLKSASVPQPLEDYAATMGRIAMRVATTGADGADYLRDV